MAEFDGVCYGSKRIRSLVGDRITGVSDNDQVQPSSFEPRIADHAYIVDTERGGLFRAGEDSQVQDRIAGMADRVRRVSLSGGYELKRGFTYLIPFQEAVRLVEGERVVASPKSSIGRLFVRTRLLADYNLGFDEIYPAGESLSLYVVVEPQVFNVIVEPGLSVLQLRFYGGVGARLSRSALLRRHDDTPLLYREAGDELVPSEIRGGDGAYLHLDLRGDVAGLRARQNPDPVDLRRRDHDASMYFDRLDAGESLTVEDGEYYLLQSKEVFDVPRGLNAAVSQHSTTGLRGPLHFAGFIDNGFTGRLVFEVRSDERGAIEVYDDMPISTVSFYETSEVEAVYGEGIGSNYDGQEGVAVAKYFSGRG